MPSSKMKQVYYRWPERHGFGIGGRGPSYVLYVAKGSAADKQGLRRGDQIIELDRHKVSHMTAPALEKLAKHINNRMPTIKVINDVQHVELTASRLYKCGLTIQYSQRNGFIIDSVLPRGPAYIAGLKQGDLILEMNGELIYEKSSSLGMIKKVLSSQRGRVTLAVLPCGRKSSSSTPRHPHQQSKASKDLYAKMNNLFAENYEKKMALIAVLKVYAERRNVEKLARSLVLILQTPGQRRIIPYIRLHIPVKDRRLFDDIVQRSIGKSYSEDRMTQSAEHTLPDYHSPRQPTVAGFDRLHIDDSHSSLLYLRTLNVHKGDGELGVVLKGGHPVVVEAVIRKSAADKAGLLKGDCILKMNQHAVHNSSHHDVQQQLKRSGPTVQLEVIQQVHMAEHSLDHPTNGSSFYSSIQSITSSGLDPVTQASALNNFNTAVISPVSYNSANQHPDLVCSHCGVPNFNRQSLPDARIDVYSYDSSTTDSNRSRSSSADWAFQNSLRPQDMGPSSFKTQVNYLLDKREKRLFKQHLYDYNNDNDIEVFVQRVTALLDTPAKMTLWSFVLPLLSSSHKEYTLERVVLPSSVTASANHLSHEAAPVAVPGSAESSSIGISHFEQLETMTSFKSQLEYLLTSQERKAVKRALLHYKENKNIQSLVETVSTILDTNSKRSLWIHILTLLPASHQNYARRKINLPSGYLRDVVDGSPTSPTSPTSTTYPTSPYSEVSPRSKRNRIIPQSEDEFFVVGQQHDIDSYDEDTHNVEMIKYEARGSYDQGDPRGHRSDPRGHHRDPSSDHRGHHSSRHDHDRDGHLHGADHFMENPLYGMFEDDKRNRFYFNFVAD